MSKDVNFTLVNKTARLKAFHENSFIHMYYTRIYFACILLSKLFLQLQSKIEFDETNNGLIAIPITHIGG